MSKTDLEITELAAKAAGFYRSTDNYGPAPQDAFVAIEPGGAMFVPLEDNAHAFLLLTTMRIALRYVKSPRSDAWWVMASFPKETQNFCENAAYPLVLPEDYMVVIRRAITCAAADVEENQGPGHQRHPREGLSPNN